MKRCGGGLALTALALCLTSASDGSAQSPAPLILSITGPAGDTLRSATPEFRVRASGGAPADRPLTLGVQVADRADFSGRLLFDASLDGEDVRLTPSRPLPDATVIYWRATARTASGATIVSDAVGPHVSAPWLTLVGPGASGVTTISARRPRFVWRAAAVAAPAGPWSFQLTVINVGSGSATVFSDLRDTTFTPPHDLDASVPYRWLVTARLRTGESTTAESTGSFIIADPAIPSATLLYQNFPNPFPTATGAATCIWFDLHRPGRVSLTVRDLRGHVVKRIVPSADVPAQLAAGRYGRGDVTGGTGCDPRFAWDGRDTEGRTAPSGIYLLHLEADGVTSFKRVAFRGR